MRTVSVTDLKAHLSRYLRMVRRGSEVQILERGVPIARLVGLQGDARTDEKERLDRLTRAGILRRGTGDLSWLLTEPPVGKHSAELLQALEEDRKDRL